MIGIVMFFVALFALLLGFPVAFTFGGIALIFGVWAEGIEMFAFMPYRIQSIMENTVLMAVPLFVFMGLVLQKTKLAEQLLESMGRLFGGIAIDQVANKVGEICVNGLQDITLSLFHTYDALPMSSVLSVVSIGLIMVFFITSSDSGSLVIDSITSGGKVDAPVPQRVFWALMGGASAAVLLWVGGTESIQALQAGTVSMALPFAFILLLMCLSLLLGLRTENQLVKHQNALS